MAAIEKIAQANADGQFRAFTGNEYLRSLENGDFVACVAWSGDIVQLQYTRPDIQFVHPRGGRHELVRHDGHPEGRRRTA